MLELFVCITLGIIVGLSVFTVLSVAIMLSPKVMKAYMNYATKVFEMVIEIGEELEEDKKQD